MRRRVLVVAAFMSIGLMQPQAAQAQFSPQGLLGAMTSPLRHLLHRLPVPHRHSPRASERAATNVPPAGATTAPAAGTRLDRLGPAAWQSAYKDVVGYLFWPNDYARPIKNRGFDVIAQTIAGPFKAPVVAARASSTTGAAAQDSTDDCNAAVPATDSWPEAQVKKTTQLSNVQQQALDKVQAQLDQSIKALKIDCRDPAENAPSDRLQALIGGLWSVRDTGVALHDALRGFDDTLSGNEHNAFAANQNVKPPPAAGNAADAANKAMQACAEQNVGEAERMIKQLEQRTRPTGEQSASLDSLHKVSTNMAKMLAGSCAQPVPNDPLTRLDAVDEQLTTMNYAATAVQIAFDDFYDKLDDQQKARLAGGR